MRISKKEKSTKSKKTPGLTTNAVSLQNKANKPQERKAGRKRSTEKKEANARVKENNNPGTNTQSQNFFLSWLLFT